MLGFAPLNNIDVNGLKRNWILDYIIGYLIPFYKSLKINPIYTTKSIIIGYYEKIINNKYKGIISELFIKYKAKLINNKYKGK